LSKIVNRKSGEPDVNAEELKKRTKQFALRAIRLVEALPRTRAAEVIGSQLLRSATSVAANYRAACRARSQADFVHKLGLVEEEADESLFWLELVVEANLLPETAVQEMIREANELTAIFVSSRKTAKRR
jgi:four helix bundle protein